MSNHKLITIAMAAVMEKSGTFDKMVMAKMTNDAQLAVEAAEETEKYALLVASQITKSDEELLREVGEDALQAKRDFEQTLIEHNYDFLDIASPFLTNTLDEVKGRNGFATDGTPFTEEAIALISEFGLE